MENRPQLEAQRRSSRSSDLVRHFGYLFDTDFREIHKWLILLARPTGGAQGLRNIGKIEITSLACRAGDTT
jgi:hypothetical protein